MANKYPSTSLTITFVTETAGAGEDEAVLQAELLAEDNGDKTRFTFTDSPKFRLYASPNVSVFNSNIFISDSGANISRTASGRTTDDITETLQFIGAASEDESTTDQIASYRQSSVSKPVYGTPTISDISGNIGAVSSPSSGFMTFACSKTSSGPLDPVIGICRVTYNSRYDLYTLSNVSRPTGFGENGFTEYPVLIYIVGVVS